jgi:hypothetical protein
MWLMQNILKLYLSVIVKFRHIIYVHTIHGLHLKMLHITLFVSRLYQVSTCDTHIKTPIPQFWIIWILL